MELENIILSEGNADPQRQTKKKSLLFVDTIWHLDTNSKALDTNI